jgi:hypothetical protein
MVISVNLKMISVKRLLICSMIVLSGSGCTNDDSPAEKLKHIQLQTIEIDGYSVQFYLAFGPDSAVLGFSIPNNAGQERYCPVYASTYPDIPPVTLEVFATNSKDEMWVKSSWSGYEVLAYHHFGTDSCISRYGESPLSGRHIPSIIGGDSKDFPSMGRDEVFKVSTIKYKE